MVRQAREAVKFLGQRGHSAHVGVANVSGVVAHAVQQHKLFAAVLASRLHGCLDLGMVGHAGGHNGGLFFRGDQGDQRQVYQLEGGNFVGGCFQRLQQVDCRGIEGSRKEGHAPLASALEQGGVPFIRGVGLTVKLV